MAALVYVVSLHRAGPARRFREYAPDLLSPRYAIRVGEVGHGLTRDGPCHPRCPTTPSGIQPREPACCLTRRGDGFRRSRGRVRVWRRPHPLANPRRGIFKPGKWPGCYPSEPCSPGKAGRSGITISAKLTARSTRATRLSIMHLWGPIRTRRTIAGFGMRWSSRSRSSISLARRPAGFSRSFRLSSSGGARSGYDWNSHSG
jgi:hypothetical protein